jgi:O-antigen/teichoic acid export membrane protein
MRRKIAKNTLLLSVSQIIGRIIGFFYFIFLARALGVETFGVYNLTLAFVYNFVPVADFGIERLVLRDISRKPEKASFYFSRLLPLRIFLAIAAYFAALALGLILGRSLRQIFYLAIFGLSIIPSSLTSLIASFQNAREKMIYLALANVSTISLTALLGVSFVFAKLSLVWILLAYVLGQSIIALIFLAKSSSWNLSFGWVIDKDFWRRTLTQSWVFAALTVLAVFYLRTSIILVGILKGNYFTGLYGSAFKFVEAIILIPQSLALALFPLSSRLYVGNKEELKAVYKKGLGVLFLFSLPFALVLIFCSKVIIQFAYGVGYLEAGPILAILTFSLVLFFINALAGNVIQNSPKVEQFLPLLFLNFVIEIILCLILIPRYSILGAAWAVVGGELAGVVINNLFVWKILR